MPVTKATWRSSAVQLLRTRLRDAGFQLDTRARAGVTEILNAHGGVTLDELLETMLDAIPARDEYAFRLAAAGGRMRKACMVVRAGYDRWVVGVTTCKASDPTPSGCAAWDLPDWKFTVNNAKRLAAWATKFDSGKLGISYLAPKVVAGKTVDDALRERELLRDVIENYDDDGPRLVYADWLADRDPPRSELIVMQCKAATLPKGPRRTTLEKRASEMRNAHASEWGFRWCYSVTYRRGFVTVVHTCLPDLVEHGRAMMETAPIEHLALAERSHDPTERSYVERVLAISGLERISTLSLAFVDPEVLRGLVTAKVFARVTTLFLNAYRLDAATVELLCRPSMLPALTHVGGSRRIDTAIRTILAARSLIRARG